MEAKQAGYGSGGGGGGGPPGRSRPMRPAPYERPERYGGGQRGSGYDPYASPRERFSADRFGGDRFGGDRFGGERFGGGLGSGGSGGRFKGMSVFTCLVCVVFIV